MSRMTFSYFVVSLQMSLMHKFTDLYIQELDSLDSGKQPEETLDAYVVRCIHAFTTLNGLTPDQSERIRKAILVTQQESKTHVITQMTVTSEGMGRGIDQIMIMTQFWEDNYQII